MTTGENIRRLRKERGLTQKQLGELCGIAEPTIRRYELDKLNPKIETIERIAQAFGVPIIQIKENLSWKEHQQTEEWRRLERGSLPFEGMEVLLEKVFGAIEEKEVMGETGWSQPYWLIGKEPNTFILYEDDIDALLSATETMLPPLVERIKDTRPESEIVQEILSELNQMESPRYRAETAPESTPAPQEGKDTTPPPDAQEGASEGE